jgi:hypothetical protein
LAGGIDNLSSIVLTLDSDGLGEGVFDGGIVALDEVAVDEAHGEGGLAWTS